MNICRMALALSFGLIALAGQPAIGQSSPDEAPNPYLQLKRPRPWAITYRVQVRAGAPGVSGGQNYAGGMTRRFEFSNAGILIPFVIKSASSRTAEDAKVEGRMRLDDAVVSTEPEVIGDPEQGWAFAQWRADAGQGMTMDVTATFETTAYETVFNERDARKLDWPVDWPAEAKESYEVSLYGIGLPRAGEAGPVLDLINKWTEGNDPKTIPPVELAKFLAGKVQEHIRSVNVARSKGRKTPQTRLDNEFNLQEVKVTIETRRASPHDITTLLAAVYRTAGIPARIVVGYEGGNGFDDDGTIRSWVEFCLYDEANNLTTWIPVDIAGLRRRGARMGDLGKPWRLFGSNPELNKIVPISFSFEGPTAVGEDEQPRMFQVWMRPGTPESLYTSLEVNLTRPARRRP